MLELWGSLNHCSVDIGTLKLVKLASENRMHSSNLTASVTFESDISKHDYLSQTKPSTGVMMNTANSILKMNACMNLKLHLSNPKFM